jgi:Zn-dependent M28 family amino/carboxypeptidase
MILSPTNPINRRVERLRNDVQRLAADIGERNFYRYDRLQQAADYIQASFLEAGYQPVYQEYEAVGKTFANIGAEIHGRQLAREIVVVGAHYDTARGSSGANDNASGVAAMLELARAFAGQAISRTLRFVALTNEERPLLRTPKMGSRVYARQCREQGEAIVAMLSLETIGYCSERRGSQWLSSFGLLYPSRGNFILLVANIASRQLLQRCAKSFRRSATISCQTVTLPGFLPGARSSDQWSFWKEGFPGLMITDTAPLRYPYYHKAEDTPEKLRYDFLDGVIEGLTGVVSDLVASDSAGANRQPVPV